MINKFRLGQYIFLILFFLIIGHFLYSSYWPLTSSGEFYIALETSGSLLALLAGISAFLFFYSNGQVFFLVLGFAFFLTSSEDLIHGLLGIRRILTLMEPGVEALPEGTILGDDLLFSIALVIAILFKKQTIKIDKIRLHIMVLLPLSIFLGAIITLISGLSSLPLLHYSERLIANPIDALTAAVFLTAFILELLRLRKEVKTFHHFLMLHIIVNLFSYTYLSFSKESHDVFFELSLVLNTISYILPTLGFLTTILEQHKELRNKEMEVIKSRNRLTSIIEASPDEIYLLQPDMKREDGKNMLSHIPMEFKNGYEEAIQNALLSGNMEQLEIKEIKEGKTNFYMIRLIPTLLPGEGIGIIHISTDITEHRVNRIALEQNERRYDLAMSVANDGIWDWDMLNNTVHFDKRYYTMVDYTPDEFPASLDEWKKRVHPDDLEATVEALDQYLKGLATKYDAEFRFLTGKGDYRWLKSSGKIVERNKDNSPARLVGTHSDIRERKKAEEELRSSMKELSQMNEIMMGREYRIIEMKQEVNDLLKELNRPVKYKVVD